MTKNELKQWIAKAKLVDSESEFDANGNHEETKIYEWQGELYRLEFQNGQAYQKWGENGRIPDAYEPRKVIRETQMVEVVTYRAAD